MATPLGGHVAMQFLIGRQAGTRLAPGLTAVGSDHPVSPKAMAWLWSQSGKIMCMKMTMLGLTTSELPA